MKFKKKNFARPQEDQRARFKILHLVPEVLSNSKTLQGILETREFHPVRKYARTEHILMTVLYYEFIAVLQGFRIKVIVKKTETDPYMFWSVIPFWKKSRSGTPLRLLHSGNVMED